MELSPIGTVHETVLGHLLMRNSILGMASRDLSNTETAILGAAPGGISDDGDPHERFSLAPALSGPVRDTPHIAQYPFEIVSQRGIAPYLPCFHWVSRQYR